MLFVVMDTQNVKGQSPKPELACNGIEALGFDLTFEFFHMAFP